MSLQDLIAGRCVLGVPGGSLGAGGSWAKTDKNIQERAAQFERNTAAVLDTYARVGGATVLHDLSMPTSKVSNKSNIDHAIVSGNTVLLLDTKWWKSGFYWTARGTTRIGFTRAPHVDKQTLAMAVTRVTAMLSNDNVGRFSVRAMVVVWPSSPKHPPSTWATDIPGAGTIPASALDHWARRNMPARRGANNDIVVSMASLLMTPPSPTGYVAAGAF